MYPAVPGVLNSAQSGIINSILRKYNGSLSMVKTSLYARVLQIGSPEWERMEFLGDAVINLAAAVHGYNKHPGFHEGKLSQFRVSLVKGTTLTAMCEFCGLSDLLSDVTHCASQCDPSVQHNTKILEDMFECFVAAIFLDHDYDEAKAWFCNVADDYMRFCKVDNDKYRGNGPENSVSIKKQLIKRIRNRGSKIDIKITHDGAKGIYAAVYVNDVIYGIAQGSNRKEAEENACVNALMYIDDKAV